ncbi:hypothetical protein Plhal304r1_c010g0040411 [Plasmopara halstedii]
MDEHIVKKRSLSHRDAALAALALARWNVKSPVSIFSGPQIIPLEVLRVLRYSSKIFIEC